MGFFSSVKENVIRERITILQENADNGDKEAMCELGKYYSNLPECRSYVCNTIQKNDNKAFHLFAKAAHRMKLDETIKYDNLDAAYLAAMCYAWGYGINQDCYKATIMFASMMIQAEDEGRTEMNYQIRSNIKKMLPEFKRRSDSQNMKDVFNYAVLLSIIGDKKQARLSEGLMDDLERKNYANAIRFNKGIDNDDITRYLISAQNGSAIAQYALALIYDNQNQIDESILWGKRAIESGYCYADLFFLMGLLNYQKGNYEKAKEIFEKQITLLDPDNDFVGNSCCFLGRIYSMAFDSASKEKSRYYYELGASYGDEHCLKELTDMRGASQEESKSKIQSDNPRVLELVEELLEDLSIADKYHKPSNAEKEEIADAGKQKIKNYIDSIVQQFEKTEELNMINRTCNGLSVGDTFEFGKYNGKPIKWIVLKKTDNILMLISYSSVSDRRFDRISNKWINCELRSWLNSEFYDSTFSKFEKEFIISSEIYTFKDQETEEEWVVYNGGYEYEPRNMVKTTDNVFVMSADEANQLFIGRPYNGELVKTFWLRSLSCVEKDEYIKCDWAACASSSNRRIDWYGTPVKNQRGVRPCLNFKYLKKNYSLQTKFEFGFFEGKKLVWRVLKKTEKTLLVMSDMIICRRLFHQDKSTNKWENCDLRKWLNHEFYDSAFSEDEKEFIVSSEISTNGKITVDKLFLLSTDEAEQFFSSDPGNEPKGWYWLRSPAKNNDCVIGVNASEDGSVNTNGYGHVDVDHGGVRPVFYIKLNY